MWKQIVAALCLFAGAESPKVQGFFPSQVANTGSNPVRAFESTRAGETSLGVRCLFLPSAGELGLDPFIERPVKLKKEHPDRSAKPQLNDEEIPELAEHKPHGLPFPITATSAAMSRVSRCAYRSAVVWMLAWPITIDRVSRRPPRLSHRVANVCRATCGLR